MLNQTDLVSEMGNLKRFALRLCRNSADADDLVQATALKALENTGSFETGSDVFKWTSKIMFNTFVSDYRRKTKFESKIDPTDIMNNIPSIESHEIHMEYLEVAQAIDHLSNEHRDILIMVCVSGMSYQDVADTLSIPLGTVRSRLSRAREQLQALMAKVRKPSSVYPPVTSFLSHDAEQYAWAA